MPIAHTHLYANEVREGRIFGVGYNAGDDRTVQEFNFYIYVLFLITSEPGSMEGREFRGNLLLGWNSSQKRPGTSEQNATDVLVL